METLYDLVRRTVEVYITPYSQQLRTAWFGLAITSFGILASGALTASYGRHHSKSSIMPNVNGKLGWMCMELVSPATILLFFQTYKLRGPSLSTGHVLLGLWLIHYINRSVLTVVLSPGMKSSRLDIVLSSVFFNLVNASWVGYDLALLNAETFTVSLKTMVGLVMFILGMAVNISSDYHLQSERRRKGGAGDQYILSEWGLYKYIVSPNYAGEVVEWTGYAIMLRRESVWSFVVWTICNLGPRARSNLAWYKEKFGDKVGNRKGMIPGVI
jgi:3-oxo-5-alpha-steroid 4-dehydrogenase 1